MEYLILNLTKDADGDTNEINEMGAAGWELMQIIVLPGVLDSSLKALFRRPDRQLGHYPIEGLIEGLSCGPLEARGDV